LGHAGGGGSFGSQLDAFPLLPKHIVDLVAMAGVDNPTAMMTATSFVVRLFIVVPSPGQFIAART